MKFYRLLAALFVVSTPLTAQQSPTIPGPGPSRLRLATPTLVDTVPHQRPVHETHALRGAMIGGLPFALLAVAVGPAFCEDTDSNGRGHDCLLRSVLAIPIAAAPAGFVGAMLGAASLKRPEEIRRSKGSYWKEVGLGLGGLSAIGGAVVRHNDCRDYSSSGCGSEALTGALILGVVNGALGAMLGSLIPKR